MISRADSSTLPLIKSFRFAIESPRLQIQPLHRLDRCHLAAFPLADHLLELRTVYRLATFVDTIFFGDSYALALLIRTQSRRQE